MDVQTEEMLKKFESGELTIEHIKEDPISALMLLEHFRPNYISINNEANNIYEVVPNITKELVSKEIDIFKEYVKDNLGDGNLSVKIILYFIEKRNNPAFLIGIASLLNLLAEMAFNTVPPTNLFKGGFYDKG